MEKLDAGDQLSELLEEQRLERVNLIGKVSHEVFQVLCAKQDKDISDLV